MNIRVVWYGPPLSSVWKKSGRWKEKCGQSDEMKNKNKREGKNRKLGVQTWKWKEKASVKRNKRGSDLTNEKCRGGRESAWYKEKREGNIGEISKRQTEIWKRSRERLRGSTMKMNECKEEDMGERETGERETWKDLGDGVKESEKDKRREGEKEEESRIERARVSKREKERVWEIEC